MRTILTLAAALTMAAAPTAIAQPAPPPGTGPAEMGQAGTGNERGGPRAGERRGERGMERRHQGRGGERDGRGHQYRGHYGSEGSAGFRIRTETGGSLSVRCGDADFAACVEASQPLLQAIGGGWTVTPPDFVPLPPADDEVPPLDETVPADPLAVDPLPPTGEEPTTGMIPEGEGPPIETLEDGLDQGPDGGALEEEDPAAATDDANGPPIETLGAEDSLTPGEDDIEPDGPDGIEIDGQTGGPAN